MSHPLNTLGAAILAVGVLAVAPSAQTSNQTPRELFPNTEDRGRAAVEYDDDTLQVVAAYYHSQRNHDSRWLLVEAAITSSDNMTIERGDIHLVRPDGRVVHLTSQRTFAQDHQRIRLLVQAARTSRHGIGAYIVRHRGRQFRFFVLPFDGIADKLFDTDQHRVAWGDLFFASPTGSWEPGTYSLVVDGGDERRATLPIDLE